MQRPPGDIVTLFQFSTMNETAGVGYLILSIVESIEAQQHVMFPFRMTTIQLK